ncbi:unnamed protein product [Brassica rapa]|uniref:Uncharacterized protein n=1 Tax=Brassica campestris TaxID=3711 RepID=A0A8D9DIB7_BRACM|nr:unnamed protein product [Brassica rapa]
MDSHRHSPLGPKSPEQSTGRASVLICVLMDVLCVLTDTHGHPVCADGHTWTSCPRTSCVCWRTPTDVLCLLNRQPTQPTWAKITRTVHGKGQSAESNDQRADMCTDGQTQTSCVPRGPKSPKQSTGRARVLSPSTKVMICVLMDSHGRPTPTDVLCVLTDTHRHTRTVTDVLCVLTDSHRQPTWAKITRTVHVRANVLICVLMDSHIRPVCADGHTQTHTDVLCVLTDTDGRPPRTSCVCWRTPTYTHGHTRTATDVLSTNVLCVLADTHGRPVCIEQTAHMGQNHPKSPQEGPSCRVQEPMC